MKKFLPTMYLLLFSLTSYAANIEGGTVLYLEPAVWKSSCSGCWYAAYFYNGSKFKWVKMTVVQDKSAYYTTTAPDGTWSNVIFVQMKSGSSTLDWANKQAQTADLVYTETYDLFTVFDNNAKMDGKNDSGVWSQMDIGSGDDPYAPVTPIYPSKEIIDCSGKNIKLNSVKSGENYSFKWSTGETTDSITVIMGETKQVVTCTVTKLARPTLENNLISNGGFENVTRACPYMGFISKYECYGVDKPFDYSKSYRGFYKIASKNNFYNVNPANGKYMLECDGDYNRKVAWSASTSDNPNLKVEKGKRYQFSYKAANGNSTYRSVLIFSIKYNGKTDLLVPARILPTDRNWHNYGDGCYWTAPEDCDNVELILEDNCHTDTGNDFFLDDIMFQPLQESVNLVAEETYTLTPKDCSPKVVEDCEGANVTLESEVSGTDYLYEWKKGDKVIVGETSKKLSVIAVLGDTNYTCTVTKTGTPLFENKFIVRGVDCGEDTTVYITDSICEGEVYKFCEEDLTTTGVYTCHSVRTKTGQDSTTILTLIVNPLFYTDEGSATICEGDTYLFHGEKFDKSGEHTVEFKSQARCDSVFVFKLIVNPSYYIDLEESIDDGDSIIFDGKVLKKSGEYKYYGKTKLGCDSIVKMTLTVRKVVPALVPDKWFTPDGDGSHDLWLVKNITEDYDVIIYDRYGKILHRFVGNFTGWDGMYNGHQMPSTDYWYIIIEKSTGIRFNGHFSLYRK